MHFVDGTGARASLERRSWHLMFRIAPPSKFPIQRSRTQTWLGKMRLRLNLRFRPVVMTRVQMDLLVVRVERARRLVLARTNLLR